jgi:hypothetical protein
MYKSVISSIPADAPLIPIVLGVVGHRNIREGKPAIQQALKKVFDELDEAYEHSPKMLLSPLAPGADQLAARVALDQGPHWTIRAPLPFEPELALQSTSFRFEHLKSDTNPQGIDIAAQEEFRLFLRDANLMNS